MPKSRTQLGARQEYITIADAERLIKEALQRERNGMYVDTPSQPQTVTTISNTTKLMDTVLSQIQVIDSRTMAVTNHIGEFLLRMGLSNDSSIPVPAPVKPNAPGVAGEFEARLQNINALFDVLEQRAHLLSRIV